MSKVNAGSILSVVKSRVYVADRQPFCLLYLFLIFRFFLRTSFTTIYSFTRHIVGTVSVMPGFESFLTDVSDKVVTQQSIYRLIVSCSNLKKGGIAGDRQPEIVFNY